VTVGGGGSGGGASPPGPSNNGGQGNTSSLGAFISTTGGGSGGHECNRRIPRTNITLQEAQHWLASGEVRQDGINRR
jgi:hypothetical protein